MTIKDNPENGVGVEKIIINEETRDDTKITHENQQESVQDIQDCFIHQPDDFDDDSDLIRLVTDAGESQQQVAIDFSKF